MDTNSNLTILSNRSVIHSPGFMNISPGLVWSTMTPGSLHAFPNMNNSFGEFPQMTLASLALSWKAQISLISLYSITIFLSIVGNLLVIVVLLSANRTRTDITVFLVNLAVADIMMACFCIPFTFTQTMLGRWVFGEFMCPVALFMQVTTVSVSIFTNMAIGLDRFWGITFPMKRKLSKRRAKAVVLIIWFTAIVMGSVQLFVTRSTEQNYFGLRYMDCNEKWLTRASRRVYSLVIACVTYIIPLIILAVVYSTIGVILWMRKAPGNADIARDKILLRSKQKVVKMVFVIVLMFALCWFPLQTFNLILDFAPQILDLLTTPRDTLIFIGVYYMCHWLAMANSFMNPIIFSFCNDNFRADLKTVIMCHHLESSEISLHSARSFLSRLSSRRSKKSKKYCFPSAPQSIEATSHSKQPVESHSEMEVNLSINDNCDFEGIHVHDSEVNNFTSEINVETHSSEGIEERDSCI